MSKLKKLIMSFLCCLLVLFLFIGCPKGDEEDPTEAPTEAPTAVPTDPPGGSVLQDFEGIEPAFGVVNWNAIATVAAIADIEAFSVGTGHGTNAMYVVNSNWAAIPKLSVTIPASTVLDDYDSLTVEYFALAGDSGWKQAVLMAANPLDTTYSNTVGTDNCIATVDNGIQNKGAWGTITFDLTTPEAAALIAALTVETFELGIGGHVPNGAIYLLDNISIVHPSNGTTVLQNFEGSAPTIGTVNYNATGVVTAIADIETISAGSGHGTNVMHVVNSNWSAIPKLSVTIPASTVLDDYTSLTVEYFALAGDSGSKQAVLMAANPLDTTYSNTVGTDNCIATVDNGIQNKGAWGTITFDLTTPEAAALIAALTVETFELGIGGHVPNGAIYLLDNITLIE